MYKVNGKDIRVIVDDPQWQQLRKELLGTWKKTPNDNLIKLKRFTGNLSSASDEKLIIIFNYLTGTVFRTKTVDFPAATIYKNQVKDELIKRKILKGN